MTRYKAKAEWLINKYKTNNPIEIISNYKNIVYRECNLGKETRGLYQYESGLKFIYINNTLDNITKKMVCAHELGHAFMHEELNVCYFKNNTLFLPSKYEREANGFAAELLLPDNLIKVYPCYNIEQIACENGIPIEICKFKNTISL